MLEAEERASAKVGYNSEKFNPIHTGFLFASSDQKRWGLRRPPPSSLTSKPLTIRLPISHRMIYSSFPTKYSLIDTITQSDVIMIVAQHISLFVGGLLLTHFTRLLSNPPTLACSAWGRGGREVFIVLTVSFSAK